MLSGKDTEHLMKVETSFPKGAILDMQDASEGQIQPSLQLKLAECFPFLLELPRDLEKNEYVRRI